MPEWEGDLSKVIEQVSGAGAPTPALAQAQGRRHQWMPALLPRLQLTGAQELPPLCQSQAKRKHMATSGSVLQGWSSPPPRPLPPAGVRGELCFHDAGPGGDTRPPTCPSAAPLRPCTPLGPRHFPSPFTMEVSDPTSQSARMGPPKAMKWARPEDPVRRLQLISGCEEHTQRDPNPWVSCL